MERKHAFLQLMSIVVLMAINLFLSTEMLMAQSWTSLSGPATPRNIKDIAISDNGLIGYTADQTYLFKTTNGGSTWTTTGTVISLPLVVACNPGNPDNVVVGLASSIKYSSNGGTGFSSVQNLPSTFTPLSLASSPVNASNFVYLGIQYVSGSKSIHYSTDGGQTFHAPTSFYNSDINDIAPHPTTGNKVYIGGTDPSNVTEGQQDDNRGMWYSTDNGQTWFVVNGTSGYDVKKIGVKNGTYDSLLMYTKTNKMFVSKTGGNHWDQGTVPDGVTNVTDIRVRTDSTKVYITTDNGIYVSTDWCSTWTSQKSGNYAALAMGTTTAINQSKLFAGTANALYTTTNSGTTWPENDNGLGRMPVTSVAVNGTNCWGVSSSYNLVASYNGSTWSNAVVDQNFTNAYNVLYHPSGDILVSGIYSQKPGLFKKVSGGGSYSQIVVNSGSTQSSTNVFKGAINDPSTTTRLYVYGEDAGFSNFYIIEDYTAQSPTIITRTIGSSSSNKVNDVIIDASSVSNGEAQILYAGLDSVGVYKFDSAPGVGWVQKAGGDSIRTVYSLAMNSSDSTLARTVYAATSTGLWRTTDAGTHWGLVTSTVSSKVIMRPGYPNDADHIAIKLSTSIWYTNNGGSTWFSGTGDLPSTINTLQAVTGGSPSVYGASDMGVYKLAPPDSAPSISSPTSGATNQALNVTAYWSSSDASSYQYIIDNNSDFSSPIVNTMLTATSYQNSGLANAATYYWKVSGINLAGQGPFQSPAYSFTTIPSITLNVGRGDPVGNVAAIRSPFLSGANRAGSPQIESLTPPQGFYVDLSWQANGTLDTCIIYRSIDGGGFSVIGSVSGSTTSYTDYEAIVLASGNQGSILSYYVAGSGTQSNTASIQIKDLWMEKRSALIPLVTELSQNYPNPFNPTTTIDYQLASPGYVRMVIYNSLGQEITTLVDEKKDVGYYSFKWNAGDAASGLYFVRINISDEQGKALYRDIKKLLLVK